MRKRVFVVTGPSGIGKSYLMQRLAARYPGVFVLPPLLTTRPPRPGERAVDRRFISERQYEAVLERGEFAWSDTFYGNRYGYTTDALQPAGKHVLINALPPMAEAFAVLPDVVMVGLTLAPDNRSLIKERLQARGDPPAAVAKRLAALEQDVRIMQKAQPTIDRHGKLFEIRDDGSIDEAIAWLRYNYL